MDKVTKPKRFYKIASVAPADGGYAVELDGRPIKTPAKATLTLPTEALAKAIAAEWNAQDETLDLQGMTLTRLANVAIDRTPDTRADLAGELARYAGTDVTCYLADAPVELQARVVEAWILWREWAGLEVVVVLLLLMGLVLWCGVGWCVGCFSLLGEGDGILECSGGEQGLDSMAERRSFVNGECGWRAGVG